MRFIKNRFAVWLGLVAVVSTTLAVAEESSLYCVGAFSPADKPHERTPRDAILTAVNKDVSLEIRTVGRGEARNSLQRLTGFESSGSLSLSPSGQSGAPLEVTWVVQNYTGEIKVSLKDGGSGSPVVIYQGKCEEKKSLIR